VNDALPVELRDAPATARETLATHPEGRVPLPERGAIWRALDQPEGDRSLLAPGHRRRAALAQFAVEKVKPFWRETFPDDPTVDRMLDAGPRYLAGELDYSELDAWINAFWHELFDRMTDESKFRASYVGHAVCGALRTAIDDEAVGYAEDGLDDPQLDSEDWDASWFASLAYSGGDEGESAYRPELRRAQLVVEKVKPVWDETFPDDPRWTDAVRGPPSSRRRCRLRRD
jgi:hypothetical protein